MFPFDVHEWMPLLPFRIVSLSIQQFCGRWKPLPADDDTDRLDVGVQIEVCEGCLGLRVNKYAWGQSDVQGYNYCGEYANQA